jgi:hypothetical protein
MFFCGEGDVQQEQLVRVHPSSRLQSRGTKHVQSKTRETIVFFAPRKVLIFFFFFRYQDGGDEENQDDFELENMESSQGADDDSSVGSDSEMSD